MCHYSREKTYLDHLFLKTIENDHKELRVKKRNEMTFYEKKKYSQVLSMYEPNYTTSHN